MRVLVNSSEKMRRLLDNICSKLHRNKRICPRITRPRDNQIPTKFGEKQQLSRQACRLLRGNRMIQESRISRLQRNKRTGPRRRITRPRDNPTKFGEKQQLSRQACQLLRGNKITQESRLSRLQLAKHAKGSANLHKE